jgi:chromosome partitioning protein
LGLTRTFSHLDTTSFHVDGRYNSAQPPDEQVVHITQGYSRDHRPDLNQVMLEHERGQRVMLVDCDLQRSSSQWMAEAAPAVRVEVLLSEDELIERAPVFQQEAEIIVADGPAGLKELTRALLLVCDTAFIPCGPSVLDVRAVSEAIRVVKQAQSIRKGIPEAMLILNKMQPRYRLSRELQAVSSKLDIPTASATIGHRQAYADAVGQGSVVWRLGVSAAPAAQELHHLFTEIVSVPQGGRK